MEKGQGYYFLTLTRINGAELCRVRAVMSLYYIKPRGLQLNYLLSPSTREEFAVPREFWKESLLDFMISLKIVKSLGVSSVLTSGRL